MDERKRNQTEAAGRNPQTNTPALPEESVQMVSDEQNTDDRPQSDENFYHNRERGNYEPGRASEEGGGSLY